MGRSYCCICKTRTTGKCLSSGKYESSFEDCFGVSAKGRVGKIRDGCRYAVTLYRKNQAFGSTDIKTFFHKLTPERIKLFPRVFYFVQNTLSILKTAGRKLSIGKVHQYQLVSWQFFSSHQKSLLIF